MFLIVLIKCKYVFKDHSGCLRKVDYKREVFRQGTNESRSEMTEHSTKVAAT